MNSQTQTEAESRLGRDEVPRAVTAAAQTWEPPEVPNASAAMQPAHRGQLRFASVRCSAFTESGLVLVWRTDIPGCAQVLLAHPYTELATDHDVVMPAPKAATPFDVVIQTDLRGVVWETQLGPTIGQIDQLVIDAVKAVCRVPAHPPSTRDAVLDEASVWVGTRLAGPLDGRWEFKRSEGECLSRLASHCTEALLSGGCRPPELVAG